MARTGATQTVVDGYREPKGYEQISSLATAQSLTKPEGAHFALIQAVTQNVRWRDDGTDPTASVGMQLEAGQQIPYYGDLDTFKVIEESASAEVNVSYYAL